MPDAAVTDLSACEQEPIHIPGSIQPHGVLLVLEPGPLTLLQASANAAGVLGTAPAAALGTRLPRLPGTLAEDGFIGWLNGADRGNPRPVQVSGAEYHYLYAEGMYADRNVGDPAVVLLDLKLPKVDGLEVLAKVKSDPKTRHIPVVMLTSSREERDLVRSYELGVNAFVVKPVDFKEFFEAIQDLGVFWAILNEPSPRGEWRR